MCGGGGGGGGGGADAAVSVLLPTDNDSEEFLVGPRRTVMN